MRAPSWVSHIHSRGVVTSLLFPCPYPSYNIDSFPGELIWVPARLHVDPGEAPTDQESVPCLWVPCESARFVLIYFHGNAEDLGRCRWFCHFLSFQFSVHVLAVEYPGYGICPGDTNRESVLENSLAALRFVTHSMGLPLNRIILFGRSIGTGPALDLAAKFRGAGLVLVSPFLSVRQLFKDRIGPLSSLIEEWFANDEAMKDVRCATLIVHGQKDALIPCEHSQALFQRCQARKMFVNPEDMEHNTDLTTDVRRLILPMFRFFALPDYCFDAIELPLWAFDKRRSPLYVKPDVQVCSNRDLSRVPSGVLATLCEPAGDLDTSLLKQSTAELPHALATSSVSVSQLAGQAVQEPLTQPTVLNVIRSATRARYVFNDAATKLPLPPDPGFGTSGCPLDCGVELGAESERLSGPGGLAIPSDPAMSVWQKALTDVEVPDPDLDVIVIDVDAGRRKPTRSMSRGAPAAAGDASP